eukprot:151092-Prorocentrum_minimum.AAC.1
MFRSPHYCSACQWAADPPLLSCTLHFPGPHLGTCLIQHQCSVCLQPSDETWDDSQDSKLCNVLFAEELQRRLAAKGSSVTVNSFGPGLITRTNFFRYQNPVFVKLFDIATNDIFHVAETVEGGGKCLAFMAVDPSLDAKGGLYFNNNINFGVKGNHEFIEFEPSEEAHNQAEAATLWKYTADLVGLPNTI